VGVTVCRCCKGMYCWQLLLSLKHSSCALGSFYNVCQQHWQALGDSPSVGPWQVMVRQEMLPQKIHWHFNQDVRLQTLHLHQTLPCAGHW
jgi:hypothetical protein